MRLHGYFRPSAAWRVRIALNLKGVQAEHVFHHLRHGGQRVPEYLRLNPQGPVPALETDDGTVLTKSLAICEWLEETYPGPPLLPGSALQRASIRAFALAIACDIHPVQNLKVLARLRALSLAEAEVTGWAHWVIGDGLAACAALLADTPGTSTSISMNRDVVVIASVRGHGRSIGKIRDRRPGRGDSTTMRSARDIASAMLCVMNMMVSPVSISQAGGGLHPAPPLVMDEAGGTGAHPGQAAGHAHEPEPAIHRPGPAWTWHKNLMTSLSPLVDCGVHYVSVMCQMTGATPVRVHGVGVRLSDELASGKYSYGHLRVVFDDGSAGWYEDGWGPTMSEIAYFVKDVVGPKGAVSIVAAEQAAQAGECAVATASSDIDSHTKTSAIREDMDLTDHMQDAVNSLRMVLAADRSIRTG